MKRCILLFLFLAFSISTYPQTSDNSKRGTIKVRKTGQLVKVGYDNVNYRLIGIDRFGNVLDSAIVEFKMSVTIQGVFYTESAIGPFLTYEMQRLLGKCDGHTILFFKNIKAKDKSGTLIEMPKFQYSLGNFDN